MRRPLQSVGRAVRIGDWWWYKIAPVLTLALAETLVDGVGPADAAWRIGLVGASGACLAAYGHVLNDAADVEVDAVAGKPNALAGWPPWARGACAIGLLGGAFGVWALRPPPVAALVVLAASAATLALYALPPVRLKARAGWGVVADAGYAHVFPTAFVLAVFAGGAHPTWWSLWWGVALIGWAAGHGVRGILVHQLRDRVTDGEAGVRTWAVEAGPEAVRRWGRGAFWVEGVAVVAALGALAHPAPGVAAGLAAVAVLTAVAKRRGWGQIPSSFAPVPDSGEGRVPLTLAVYVWPGLWIGGTLVAGDPAYAWVVGGWVLASLKPVLIVVWEWIAILPAPVLRPLRSTWRWMGRRPSRARGRGGGSRRVGLHSQAPPSSDTLPLPRAD